MSDFMKSLFDFYKERIESPFVFAFCMAWLVVNRQFVFLIAFYNGNDKHQVLLNHQFHISDYFYIPLVFTALYVVFVPFINNSLQLAKYSILNLIQDRVQTSKSAYLDAMELKKLRIERAVFLKERENFENEKLESAREINALRDRNEDLVIKLRDANNFHQVSEKLVKYYEILVRALMIRLNGKDKSISISQRVTSCCSIVFYDEVTSRVTAPIPIENLAFEFDMSFKDFISICQNGKVNDLYEFKTSSDKLIRIRIKEIQHVSDAGTSHEYIPFDIKSEQRPII